MGEGWLWLTSIPGICSGIEVCVSPQYPFVCSSIVLASLLYMSYPQGHSDEVHDADKNHGCELLSPIAIPWPGI